MKSPRILFILVCASTLVFLLQKLLTARLLRPDLSSSDIRKYDAQDSPLVLNVHVVPHTHDDVGWLKTVEQYYYGQNLTIQLACVQNILDSVVEALLDNPSRTFVYVEMKFFSMWWKQQSPAIRESVRGLVQNGQLAFANGGWCMHDEAATHFMGMIDQTSLGHSFLKQELGVVPTVGWQLDPFGHSATQASLLTGSVGFDALYFGRLDHQDLRLRQDTQECEGLWSSSPSLNTTAFWGLTGSYSGNYGAPVGFCYDITCHDKSLIDMNQAQLLDKIKILVQELKVQSDRTKGNHIMITMGGDFTYQEANSLYANVDAMIGSLKLFQQWGLIDIPSLMGPSFERINIFYSSPEYYTLSKYQQTKKMSLTTRLETKNRSASAQWSTKRDDFFPYSDCPHCFWTGYFTSRSALKRFERVSSAFLMAARQIEAIPETDAATKEECLCESDCNCDQPLFDLEDASGVVQHHDGVSGTAKQHVANDYSKRLQAGMNKAAAYVEQKLKRILGGNGTSNVLSNLRYCQLINETICEVSQEASQTSGMDIYVVMYNAVGSNKSSIVRLPVSAIGPFDVTRAASNSAPEGFTLSAIPNLFAPSEPGAASAKFVLVFDSGPLEPVGATVFRIHRSSVKGELVDESTSDLQPSEFQFDESDDIDDSTDVVADNGLLMAKFHRYTGELVSISTGQVSLNVSQTWGYYTSYDSTLSSTTDGFDPADQNSGAYIFRPSTPDTNLHPISYSKGVKFVRTSLGFEVLAKFEEPWITQVTRVMKGLPYVEVEYKIGPIPVDDGRGKEVITKFTTPIISDGTFHTDSNGREFQERRRNFRPTYPLDLHEPVAGNYYPVNAAVYVEDQTASLCVLVDRSQGGSSLADGSVELMPQRRTLADDSRGVGEAMNETDGGLSPYPPYGDAKRWGNGVVIRGTYRILVGQGMSGASIARSLMDESFAPPLLFAASAPSGAGAPLARNSFSALQTALPPNIMLVTFKKLHGSAPNQYLIRLGHQYSVNEDASLSQPVQLNLSQLFSGWKVVSAVEMTLSGNEEYNNWVKNRLDWTGHDLRALSTLDGAEQSVVLQPMEVRTFVMTLQPL